jgi:cyclin-dependent kinase 8/11
MGYEFLHGLFSYNPDTRLTAKQALHHAWFGEEPKPTWKYVFNGFHHPLPAWITDPLPWHSVFQSVTAQQMPPHRPISQDDGAGAPSMMPAQTSQAAQAHHGNGAGPGQRAGSATSFTSVSAGGHAGQAGSGGAHMSTRKKAPPGRTYG